MYRVADGGINQTKKNIECTNTLSTNDSFEKQIKNNHP